MKTSIDDRTEKSISLFLKLRRILNILIVIALIVVVYNLFQYNQESLYITVLVGLIILQGINLLFIKPSINYTITDNTKYNQLNEAINTIKLCNEIWFSYDGYKAENTTLNFGKPDLLKTNIECYKLCAKKLKSKVYFLPDKLIIIKGTQSVFLDYTDIIFAEGNTKGNIRTSDAKIYSQEWEHQRKDGTPDKRYKDNRLITTYLYGTVSLEYSGSDLFHIILTDIDRTTPFITKLKEAGYKTR